MNLGAVQAFMRERRIGGWLLHDFRGNNPVLARILPGKRWTTRRAALFIPADGEAVLLAHTIDAAQFDKAGVKREIYTSWQELHAFLGRAAAAGRRSRSWASPTAARWSWCGRLGPRSSPAPT